MKVFKRHTTETGSKNNIPDAQAILHSSPIWNKTAEERAAMTLSCRDTDYIPKVNNAGQIINLKNRRIQVMHNGLKMEAGGYHGQWMEKIIKELKGHHEPQEEKAFFEILHRIGANGTMIELGSFWAYYSIWFNNHIKNARNVCCEPDSKNLRIGERNAILNNTKNIDFYLAAAGSDDGREVPVVMDSNPSQTKYIRIKTVDKIMKDKGWEYLDLLHLDIQGYELEALKGASKTIKRGELRFLIVSTHHYFFSGSPTTHQDCIAYIKERGGHIIASHTVPESFSGDGLIIASFEPKDIDYAIDISLNHTDNSLFRAYEYDIALLSNAYNNLKRQNRKS